MKNQVSDRLGKRMCMCFLISGLSSSKMGWLEYQENIWVRGCWGMVTSPEWV